MALRVLVTTTSFLDTPGPHHDQLRGAGYELVTARGPLAEEKMLEIIGDGQQFDAYLCGDDAFTPKVLQATLPRCKGVSKYGIGLDKIDLKAATDLKIPVTNTPGVNHTTVAEHTFGLLLSLVRLIPEENQIVHQAGWKRLTGHELAGKTIGVLGLGRIGKEVAKRAMAFGMKVLAYDIHWPPANDQFVSDLNRIFAGPVFSEFPPSIQRVADPEAALAQADYIALHMNLTPENREFLNTARLSKCKKGVYIVNPSRGGLISEQAMAEAVKSGQVAGYGTDVVEPEPIVKDNPLIGVANIHLTPHIGSRTHESVVRQATAAVTNLIALLSGKEPLARANKV